MTVSAQDAHPFPIYNARFRVIFPILDADGDLVTGATGLDSEASQDSGTFADVTNEATEIATSSGMYYLDLIATEMDTISTTLIVKTSSAGAKTTPITLHPVRLPVLRTGTAQAGAATTITLDSGASADDDYYNGCYVNITNNSPANAQGQARKITDYVGSTKVATVGTWGTNPSSASTFEILVPPELHGVLWGGSPVEDVTTAGRPEVRVAAIANSAIAAATFAAGAIDAAAIANNAIDDTAIATGAITAAKFAAGAIDAAAIATDAIGAAEIADGAITAATFAAGAIDAAAIANGAIDAATFAAGAIDAAAIATDAIGAAEIADGAITAATFAAGAIDATAIAANAIDRATFAADTGMQSIRSATAAAGAAGTITLDASASAVDDFYNGARIYLTGGTGVGQHRVIYDYVGATKVANVTPNWATTPDATSTFAILPAGQVSVEAWARAVVNALIAGRVDANTQAMAAGVIAAATFAAGAIDAAAIANDAIDATAIATGAITAAKFAAGAIDAAAIANGAIDAAAFAAGAIDAAAIAANAIDADALAADAVDEIWDEAMAEPSQAIPGATPALRTVLAYLYTALRNAITVTSTTKTFSNDAGTVIFKKALSDDGTTYTEAEAVAGP